jgi:serine phosphatase RsbU (regulator of sigma subunit)
MLTIPSVAERQAVDFGIDRLMAICVARGGLSPQELLRQIFLAVHSFTHVIQQHDDMAAAILQLDF